MHGQSEDVKQQRYIHTSSDSEDFHCGTSATTSHRQPRGRLDDVSYQTDMQTLHAPSQVRGRGRFRPARHRGLVRVQSLGGSVGRSQARLVYPHVHTTDLSPSTCAPRRQAASDSRPQQDDDTPPRSVRGSARRQNQLTFQLLSYNVDADTFAACALR